MDHLTRLPNQAETHSSNSWRIHNHGAAREADDTYTLRFHCGSWLQQEKELGRRDQVYYQLIWLTLHRR